MFHRKSKRVLQVLVAGFLSLQIGALAAEHTQLKAFPAAKEDMDRFVVVLPHKERGEEEAFKVKIIPGKTMLTDEVNLMRLGTTIEPRPLKEKGTGELLISQATTSVFYTLPGQFFGFINYFSRSTTNPIVQEGKTAADIRSR